MKPCCERDHDQDGNCDRHKEVTIGSRWQHHNGNIYTVLHIANHASDHEDRYPKTVVYQGENGNVWSRPLSDWHRSMTFLSRA